MRLHTIARNRLSFRPLVFCLWLMLLLPLLLSGCSAMDEVALGVANRTLLAQRAPAPATPNLSFDTVSQNRLLVLARDGNIFSVDPNGENRFALTTDASTRRHYAQPTWSADGSRIAYTQADGLRSRLVTVRADGTERQEIDVPFPPFYLFWNASGDGLAYLSNWVVQRQPTIALSVVDFSETPFSFQPVSLGQPLYFSWSPDGTQLLTHNSNREVSLMGLDGSRTVLVERSSNFAAPQWLADGTHLLYGIQEEGRQQIVLTDLEGRVEESIAFNGIASFEGSQRGDKIAFVDTPEPLGMNSLGPLFLLDFEEQVYRLLSEEPVVYFSWSPDGEKLLYMTFEMQRGQFWLHLHVWDGSRVVPLSRFLPTETFFTQYLRFSDQYAQNHSYWSPDSDRIVFSGWLEDRRGGIWVQAADGASEPVYVAQGVYATWSPR